MDHNYEAQGDILDSWRDFERRIWWYGTYLTHSQLSWDQPVIVVQWMLLFPKTTAQKIMQFFAQVKGEKYKILKMMGTKLEFLLHHSNNSKNKGTKFILSYMTMQRFN